MRLRALIGLCLLAALPAAASAQSLSYVDLVKRLTDLETLSVLPPAGERCVQWSSYDRASRIDEKGQYVAWDANGDGGGFIRRENGKQVLAEMEGPGVIWRIWSAAPGNGNVRIYLDGAAEPAIDLPFSQYFDGKHFPFIYPSLVYDAASGKNAFVPIPFQKSCKITADDGWGLYFHFTYATYPKTVTVPTFTRWLSVPEMVALQDVDEMLTRGLGNDPAGARDGEKTLKRKLRLRPGQTVKVATLEGPRAITAMRASGRFANKEDETLGLRELALKVTWDDETAPAVWAPLGDFFGTVPGLNAYQTLPTGVTADGGMYALWYMPFASKAVVELTNDGPKARSVEVDLTHAPLARPIQGLGRFHAKWHRDVLPAPEEARRRIDWTMLEATGTGRFCGVLLHVWNPQGGWWGEGDEKFYVDGEKFPSTFGTGSEDYFGYAWCNPALFQKGFHAQSFNSGGNKGHAVVKRWHVADNVPFMTGFKADIEKYYPNDRPTLYAATAFWYQAPGQADPFGPAPLAQRVGYFEPPRPRVVLKGAVEGEAIRIVGITGGKTEAQPLGDRGPDWSNDQHLWWTEGKVGDKLSVALPIPGDGRYRLTTQLTKANDYGIVQLSLDGKPLGGPIDLYHDSVVATGVLDLGVHDLTKGDHVLQVEITGANEKAVKKFMFGLDYLRAERVP